MLKKKYIFCLIYFKYNIFKDRLFKITFFFNITTSTSQECDVDIVTRKFNYIRKDFMK